MKKQATRQHNISTLAGLLLLGIFAVCILSTLLTGAGVYRRLTARNNAVMEQRSRLQYVATRVRQSAEGARIEPFGGGTALVLPEHIGEGTYLTRIYCHDGWLMELFSDADSPAAPEDGEKLVAAEALALETDGQLLTVSISGEDGDTSQLRLLLRTGAEVAP